MLAAILNVSPYDLPQGLDLAQLHSDFFGLTGYHNHL